jgi:hypothetical protein
MRAIILKKHFAAALSLALLPAMALVAGFGDWEPKDFAYWTYTDLPMPSEEQLQAFCKMTLAEHERYHQEKMREAQALSDTFEGYIRSWYVLCSAMTSFAQDLWLMKGHDTRRTGQSKSNGPKALDLSKSWVGSGHRANFGGIRPLC